MFGLSPVKVFATRGSDGLAKDICKALQSRLPIDLQPNGCLTLSKPKITRFSNDNLLVQVENVRDHFVVIIHTQVPPVNDRLIELFALLDAVTNASAGDILLVFPHMPYARSDRKNQPRISTMGYCLPHILSTSFGIKRVLLLDPHDSHIKHYFYPAADEISAIYLLIDFLNQEVFTSRPKEDTVVVFSDAGAVKRYGEIPHLLGLDEAYIAKDRPGNTERPEFKRVIGEVEGRDCLLFDDEILTGGTAIGDAKMLLDEDASSVYMLAVHAILADNRTSMAKLMQKLEGSPIGRFIVTDSVPVRHKLDPERSKFTILSVANLLAEAIKRAVIGESLTELYNLEKVSLYR